MAGKADQNKDAAMAAHLKSMGVPHGKRLTSSNVKLDRNQVGSNKYVRYLASRQAKRIR